MTRILYKSITKLKTIVKNKKLQVLKKLSILKFRETWNIKKLIKKEENIPSGISLLLWRFFMSFQCKVTPCLSLRFWLLGLKRGDDFTFEVEIKADVPIWRLLPLTKAFFPARR